jgi:hypothetical protein
MNNGRGRNSLMGSALWPGSGSGPPHKFNNARYSSFMRHKLFLGIIDRLLKMRVSRSAGLCHVMCTDPLLVRVYALHA